MDKDFIKERIADEENEILVLRGKIDEIDNNAKAIFHLSKSIEHLGEGYKATKAKVLAQVKYHEREKKRLKEELGNTPPKETKE